MINVDLPIKDENGRTLVSWYNKRYTGTEWHVPGTSSASMEKREIRGQKGAEAEIGTDVKVKSSPIAINQMMKVVQQIRCNVMSLLSRCFAQGAFVPQNTKRSENDNCYFAWHDLCTQSLCQFQESYRNYMET
ncbi:MAG: hypothetical protein K9L30_18335 [Desulfobacterales bacterium]|nr:hypothetical protein [Desulfobacterales bacterium]